MTLLLKQKLAQITRLTSARGFGIQSPWAYHLMTDVIARPSHGSACERLSRLYPRQTKTERRRHELLFRLSERLHVQAYVDFTSDAIAADYVAASSGKAASMPWHKDGIATENHPALYLCAINEPHITEVTAHAAATDLLIVENIRRDNQSKELWQQLRDSPSTGITFDLYGLALVFFNHKMAKQHYRGPVF